MKNIKIVELASFLDIKLMLVNFQISLGIQLRRRGVAGITRFRGLWGPNEFMLDSSWPVGVLVSGILNVGKRSSLSLLFKTHFRANLSVNFKHCGSKIKIIKN